MTKTLQVMGVGVDLLLTGAETAGAFAMYRLTAEPGAGAPPHVHRNDDEAFTVLEGSFEVLQGARWQRLETGESVFLPRGVPHAFRCVGETTGVLLGVATPAGHEHFYREAAALSFPPDPAEAAVVCARHGMELVAPPGVSPCSGRRRP